MNPKAVILAGIVILLIVIAAILMSSSVKKQSHRISIDINYLIDSAISSRGFRAGLEMPTLITISPLNQTVYAGSKFTIQMTVSPSANIAGMQTNLNFNPNLIQFETVSEGDLFKVPPMNQTFFNKGLINNSLGSVNNIYCVILGNYSQNKTGTFVTMTGYAKEKGLNTFTISNAKIGRPDGTSVYVRFNSSELNVISVPWDINEDGEVDILDLLLVGNHYGSSLVGRWDTNSDGIVDILDLLRVTAQMEG